MTSDDPLEPVFELIGDPTAVSVSLEGGVAWPQVEGLWWEASYRDAEVQMGGVGPDPQAAVADLRRFLAFHLLSKAAAHIPDVIDIDVDYDPFNCVVVRLKGGATLLLGVSEADEASMELTHRFLGRPDPGSLVVVVPIGRRLADAQATADEIMEMACRL